MQFLQCPRHIKLLVQQQSSTLLVIWSSFYFGRVVYTAFNFTGPSALHLNSFFLRSVKDMSVAIMDNTSSARTQAQQQKPCSD